MDYSDIIIITDCPTKQQRIQEEIPELKVIKFVQKHTNIFTYSSQFKGNKSVIKFEPKGNYYNNFKQTIQVAAQGYKYCVFITDLDPERELMVYSMSAFLDELGVRHSFAAVKDTTIDTFRSTIRLHVLNLKKGKKISTKVKRIEVLATQHYISFIMAKLIKSKSNFLEKYDIYLDKAIVMSLNLIDTLERESKTKEQWQEIHITTSCNNKGYICIPFSVGIHSLYPENGVLKPIWLKLCGNIKNNKQQLVLNKTNLSLDIPKAGDPTRFRNEIDINSITKLFSNTNYIEMLGGVKEFNINSHKPVNIDYFIEKAGKQGYPPIEVIIKELLTLYNHGLITWPKTSSEQLPLNIITNVLQYAKSKNIITKRKDILDELAVKTNCAICPTNFFNEPDSIIDKIPPNKRKNSKVLIQLYTEIHNNSLYSVDNAPEKETEYSYALGPRTANIPIGKSQEGHLYPIKFEDKNLKYGKYQIKEIEVRECNSQSADITPSKVCNLLCELGLYQPTSIKYIIESLEKSPLFNIESNIITLSKKGQTVLTLLKNNMQFLLDIESTIKMNKTLDSCLQGVSRPNHIVYMWENTIKTEMNKKSVKPLVKITKQTEIKKPSIKK